MVKTLIEAIQPKNLLSEPYKREARNDGSAILRVAEHFYDTIQGENYVGVPAAFLRLQGCTLDCVWCDTAEVWRRGNPYSVKEIVDMWDESGLSEKFKQGQHLILTGGSPLKQQSALTDLIKTYMERHHSKPFIEIENECTLMPTAEFVQYVDLWNNSPKLANSKMPLRARYKPTVLQMLGQMLNSYFKFVVQSEDEWNEIKRDFIDPGYVRKDKIVLMPEGQTREELQQHYQVVVDIAVREGVRMTDRMHVTIWDKKTGV